MAVGHDTATESHTGTTGSASEASFSWTHTGAASGVRGVGVLVFTNADAADVLSVDYGGVRLLPIVGGEAADTAGEAGRAKLFYCGASPLPQGSQTVKVTRVNNADVMYAVAFTQTGDSTKDLAVHEAGIVLEQVDGTLAEESVTDGSPGSNSLRYGGVNSGLAAPPGVGASSTALQNIDFGARGVAVCRETTAGQGARNVGFSSGTSDDRAGVYFAVKEITPPNPPATIVVAPYKPL